MLKALELAGFKSFADRTRFEFPRGVSIVVGPNGSGKSNVVDSIKWVLGSQSAKALRGQEMTDVIFNGCASRGPLGTAEVTLTLDNADGQLPIDSRDVHVTRRVYRSGEAEYLINRQPCRLRDIKDLLAGTGITTEAYCIIEQGKVDSLLQSSPRDRRVIFEEAAGISQFKAKKVAALRRLERVEQNLLRLSDIVDEVDSRVRSVRSQAGKARRYRDCAGRLQELRTQLGLDDWRMFTEQIDARSQQLTELAEREQQLELALAVRESQAQEIERQLESSLEEQRGLEAAASATRELIAARQAAVDSQRTRHGELQQDIARLRRQLAAMNSRVGNTSQQLRDSQAEFDVAKRDLAAMHVEMQAHLELQQQARAQLDEAHPSHQRARGELENTTRLVTELANQLASFQKQQSALHAEVEQLRPQLVALDREQAERAAHLSQQQQVEAELDRQFAALQQQRAVHEHALVNLRRELARADKLQRQLEERLTRTRERINVLTELEERLEGIDGGVQQILKMAQADPHGPLGAVHGVVADLFHVDVDTAPLVEVALGERAQFVVLSTGEPLLELLRREPLAVSGRVGFLRMDLRPPITALDQIDLRAEPGVMGRADRYIEAAVEFQPLVQRLLGRTWLVDRLATAVRLMQGAGRGLEFVTSDGELLMADGTLVVGPRSAVIGILSRRSELRACHEQVAEVERQLADQSSVHTRLQNECTQHDEIVAAARATVVDVSVKLTEARQHVAAARMQLEQVHRECERARERSNRCERQLTELTAELATTTARHAEATSASTACAESVKLHADTAAAAEREFAALHAATTERQVATARCEERVELLRHRLDQAARDQDERHRAQADTRQRQATRVTQLAETDSGLLAGRQELAMLFLEKERHAAALAGFNGADDSLRRRRNESKSAVQTVRGQLTSLQAQKHKLEAVVDRLRHERQTIGQRMQDDYQIDLAAIAETRGQGAGGGEQGILDAEVGSTAIDREVVEREIAELRNQLGSIGAVNIDALNEIDELESRFGRLSTQHRDLVDAKAALERVIQRINGDTRQLFVSTLEMVRGHFQELFRRVFGGGEADIVLDESEDVLECGIEIIARPPGKEACSISLLSGGEKTLTCVALLLAVFRSKPSPFCVLDEVDAALDEANIGRFVAVLRDFLSFTQFVIVTHSKKTMSGGDTLYGVTMEESGVSKRVAVRFEDVTEDGHILPAIRRAA